MKPIAGTPLRMMRTAIWRVAILTLIVGPLLTGLVPIDIVERLTTEKPDIRGIALPGMPMGAPGMPGMKDGPFTVYEISPGEAKVYAVE